MNSSIRLYSKKINHLWWFTIMYNNIVHLTCFIDHEIFICETDSFATFSDAWSTQGTLAITLSVLCEMFHINSPAFTPVMHSNIFLAGCSCCLQTCTHEAVILRNSRISVIHLFLVSLEDTKKAMAQKRSCSWKFHLMVYRHLLGNLLGV